MNVYVDPRAGSLELLEFFPPGFAELMYLESGDVMGTGNGPNGSLLWGVEVKKLPDLLQSLQSGRLVDQLGRMHEDYDWKFLLVQGEVRMCPKTGHLQQKIRKHFRGKWAEFWVDALFGNRSRMMYQHYMSWVMSVTLCSGTYLLQSTSSQSSAATIAGLSQQLSKPWDSHSSLKTFNEGHQPTLYVPTVAMKVARDLAEGIGWEKAARAADKFRTAKALVNATVSEWKEVEGIDTVLAERLVKGAEMEHVLRRRWKQQEERQAAAAAATEKKVVKRKRVSKAKK
jgi:ERCC4-type nuclease